MFENPRAKFQRMFGSRKQIWVVGYLNSTMEDAFRDLEISKEGGADGIVWETKDYKKMDEYLAVLRKKDPQFKMGANLLGPDENLGTFAETFELTKKHNLEIAWTDFSGVDQINEMKDLDLHAIETKRSDSFFYVSGVHMKYSTLRDPKKTIQKSALQVMGWVDGIIITGSQTGSAADPKLVAAVRETVGSYPVGLASGVTAENISGFLPFIDFVLVNTGIAVESHRIDLAKLTKLRQAMGT